MSKQFHKDKIINEHIVYRVAYGVILAFPELLGLGPLFDLPHSIISIEYVENRRQGNLRAVTNSHYGFNGVSNEIVPRYCPIMTVKDGHKPHISDLNV